jgi:hypothetical protein
LNTRKHGTAVDVNARDAAVAASLLLQHGCHVDTLRKGRVTAMVLLRGRWRAHWTC